ncbi:MAG: hypothetical protein ACREWJ_02455 [Rhodoferax sp.]
MPIQLQPFSRSRGAIALLCATFALSLSVADVVAAETKSRKNKPASVHAPKARKAGRVKQEKSSAETRSERDRRLQRECKGLPNAGACLGYGS